MCTICTTPSHVRPRATTSYLPYPSRFGTRPTSQSCSLLFNVQSFDHALPSIHASWRSSTFKMGKLVRLELFSMFPVASLVPMMRHQMLTRCARRLQVLQGPPHPSLRQLVFHLDYRPQWIRQIQFVSSSAKSLHTRWVCANSTRQHGRDLLRPGDQVRPTALLPPERARLPRPGHED